MNVLKTNAYETILKTVHQWPPDRRFALVRDIINTLAPEVVSSRPRHKTLEKALGLLATGRPAPTHVDAQQWQDERRMEKDS